MDNLFGIGPMELAFIFLLAFILLGPRDLPRLAYQLGRWLRQARLLYEEFREEWEAEAQAMGRELERAASEPPEVALPPEAAAYRLPPARGTAHADPSTVDRPKD